MRPLVLLGVLSLLGCTHPEPSGITVRVSTPKGWRNQRIFVDGQGAAFDVDYAKFWQKQNEQETSAPLPAAVKTVAGRAVELAISPTPCGDIKVPATLTVADEKITRPMWAEVKVDHKPPTKTRLILDLPGAKNIKIGSYTLDAHDVELKEVMLYELGCAPLSITVDDKPLDAKLVDGTIDGQDIGETKVEQPDHSFVVEQPQTQTYLITTRGGCYQEAAQGYGADATKVEKVLTGGSVYKLAWANIDYELKELPAQISVATSQSGSHVAGESKKAVYAVACP